MFVDDFILTVNHAKETSSFSSQLFRLMFKADHTHLDQLSLAFPNEVELFRWWRGSPAKPSDEAIRDFVSKQEAFLKSAEIK